MADGSVRKNNNSNSRLYNIHVYKTRRQTAACALGLLLLHYSDDDGIMIFPHEVRCVYIVIIFSAALRVHNDIHRVLIIRSTNLYAFRLAVTIYHNAVSAATRLRRRGFHLVIKIIEKIKQNKTYGARAVRLITSK